MKTFTENYDPIEIELIDLKKKSHKFKGVLINGTLMKKLVAIINNEEGDDFYKIFQPMILIFGQTEKFWEQFSIQLLREVIEYVTKEMSKKNIKKKTG